MVSKTDRLLKQLTNIPQNTSFGNFTLPNHDGIKRHLADREIAPAPGLHAVTHEVGGADPVTITHAQTTGQTANDHHAQLHAVSHEALGADVITHNNLTLGANDHHAQAHLHNGLDGSGLVPHANTTLQTANDHHAQLHVAEHELGGGDVLTHNNLAIGANDHHAQAHLHNGLDGSGQVAHADTTLQTANDHHNQLHAATHANLGGDDVNHDTLLNFVANEHIDWTNTNANLLTTGTGTFSTLTLTGGDVTIPNAIDMRVLLGDALGANRFRIMDSNLNSVFICDSNGDIVTYGAITFNISGGSITQLPAGVIIAAGAGAGDILTLQSTSIAGSDFLTISDGVGTSCTANTVNTIAHTWNDVNLTTGICHDTQALLGTSGSGYKITLDSDNAADFRAIHVVAGVGANITVHRVDERGLIRNFTNTGGSRWRRRTWKGSTEMETENNAAISKYAWANSPHYKQIAYGNNGIYWTMQIPLDWDGATDIPCVARLVVDQAGGIGPLDTFSWNMSMSCAQAGDLMGVNAQAANGFYSPGIVTPRWTIFEISWVVNWNSVPGPLQAGDHISFHLYSTTFGGTDEFESVGVIGAFMDYKTDTPELYDTTV